MIIPINDEFRSQVNQLIADEWAGPIVVTKGVAHDTSDSDGFISVQDGVLTGYVLYTIENGQCEILVLHSLVENQGIGSALIRSVMDIAGKNGCSRVWLITTNDNIHAIRYYQRFGFALKGVYIDALDESRKLKPSIPQLGNENIPIQHEFEFSYAL